MYRYLLTLGALALAMTAPVRAEDCPFPKAPDTVPDGRTASEPEMLAAMQAFKEYNDAVTSFGTCLEEETKRRAAGTAQLLQLKTIQARKHNAALDELQAKARVFNEQVRIYKARAG